MNTVDVDARAHFFDLSLDLLCVLDAYGRIHFANSAFLTNLARNADAAQMSLSDYVLAEDRPEMHSALSQLRESNHPFSLECRFVFRDSTMRWYLWTFYPQPAGEIHGVGRDITPYREMEAKEAERNIFAEALLDTVLAINSSLALSQVLERILSNIGKVVAYEYVCILFVHAETGEAEVVGVQSGVRHAIRERRGQRFSIRDNEYLWQMYSSRESVIASELERPPLWMDASNGASAGAFLGSPIIVDQKVIGFLCVFNSKKEFFAPLHAQQLITFANQAGIAINNARLYEQAQSAAVLRERQRMAQELHDAVNQDLFAASAYADLLPKAISQKPDSVSEYTAKIAQLIRGAVDQMRMILIELQSDTVTTTRLDILLQQVCDIFSRRMGIPVRLVSKNICLLEAQVQIAIYRIAQEALHNAHKHAGASAVKVALTISNNILTLTIEDDGTGFDAETSILMHFGLRNMHQRARAIGAELDIVSTQGQGTKIKLRKALS
jgi:signal transduction histidine kinase